ncbi:hypothetical protein BKP43_32850 [Variovorax boronicumulans]|nr:hypothetical protein BKP43_32850 [Variovorax boronicumulans]
MAAASPTIGQLINALSPGIFKTLEKVKPSGTLQVRKQKNGAVGFYWRYSIGASSERVSIGLYDSSAPPKSLTATTKGYSVAAAVRAAETLSIEHHEHKEQGGRPALLEAKRVAKEAAAAKARAATENTLAQLLDHYADHLEKLGRSSHRDARSIFELHVKQAWPKIASLPANQVSGVYIAGMMRRLALAGKGRTANKLRSYVRAAYQTARAWRSKASIPEHFKVFDVQHNPAADTEPDETQNRSAKDPLMTDQLRQYWTAIRSIDNFKGAVLRLHLLTGGQRIEQFVRFHTNDFDEEQITLFDGKGRPGKPARKHSIPLIPDALEALKACNPQGVYAISTDKGKTHLAATTLSKWAKEAASAIPDFQAKRIRSGVETLLASAGISSDIRGRLQSHGIAGVQARHYDGYDYLVEKKLALETLHSRLVDPNVQAETSTRAALVRPPSRPTASLSISSAGPAE